MIIHSSNFPIRQIPVCKQPFSESHNPLSTNPAVIQVKVSEKKNTINFSTSKWLYPKASRWKETYFVVSKVL